jgi:hypothetical protein
VSFTGFFGISCGRGMTTAFPTAFPTAFVVLPLGTLFVPFAFTFAFAAGFAFAPVLGAGLLAFGFGAGFFAAFFGCGLGIGNSVFWNEKGGIDTDFTHGAQGDNGNIFRAAPRAVRMWKTGAHFHELALP